MADTRPRILDPYTGEDLGPAERIPGELERARDLDTGYEGTKPNPVYRGLPAATLYIDPNGEIVSVGVTRKADLPEEEKRRLIREQHKRQGRHKKRKGPGDSPRPPTPEVRQVVDLMAALKASLAGGSTEEVRDASLCDPERTPRMRQPADGEPVTPAAPTALTRSLEGTDEGRATLEARSYALTLRGNNRMTAEAVPAKAGKSPVTLYDLTRGLADLEAFIDENADVIIAAGGDLDAVPGLLEQLEKLEGEFVQKVERVALFIQNRAALEAARRGEAERFKHLADTDKRVVESLKAYLVRCQRAAGRPKVETAHVRSSVQRNSQQSVERAKDATPLADLHALATGKMFADAETCQAVLSCIVEEPPAPRIFSLERGAVLAIWKLAYDAERARLEQEAEAAHAEGGRGMSEYELDRQAQHGANQHPALVALNVTVSQGFHVRLR